MKTVAHDLYAWNLDKPHDYKHKNFRLTISRVCNHMKYHLKIIFDFIFGLYAEGFAIYNLYNAVIIEQR